MFPKIEFLRSHQRIRENAMKHTLGRFASLILLASMVCGPALLKPVLAGDDPRMSAEERAKVKKYLAE